MKKRKGKSLRSRYSHLNYGSTRAALAVAVMVILFLGCRSPSQIKESFEASVSKLGSTATEAPVISSPNTSPFYTTATLTVTGTCNSGDTVYVGDSSATVSGPCSGDAFSILVSKSSDGTYPYLVYAVDSAGHSSTTQTIQWTRLSMPPSAPVITSPAANPYYSSASITLSGTCTNDLTVQLSGDSSQTVTCAASAFSFVVSKSVDSTYNFSITQIGPSGLVSSAATRQWIRDSVAPSVNLTGYPSSINLSSSATFTFNANETSTFTCSLDGGSYVSCSSPQTYSSLSNGAHTFQFKSTDLASNVTTSTVYNWTQAVYNTVALYHFDSSPGFTVDSSSLPGSTNNPLTNSGTTAGGTAEFNQSRLFTMGSSNFMSTPDNASHALLRDKMTIEAFVKLTSNPTASDVYVIASKTTTPSGPYGWEFGIVKNGSSQSLYFSGAIDGGAPTVVTSTTMNFGTSQFRYVAMTWNNGAVNFYYENSTKGSFTIGSGSVQLNNQAVPLKIGTNGTNYINATIDEVRISKIVRTISGVPGSAFSPD